MLELRSKLLEKIPNLIISIPESALYFVIDFKMIFNNDFDIENFIEYCATIGKSRINNNDYTILLAPMTGFYHDKNKGRTQARVAIVEPEENIKIFPAILSDLIKNYTESVRVN